MGLQPHRRAAVCNHLQQLFPNRVVGLGHPVEWPPRSPDLTPLDIWLWGDVKSKVYSEGPPRTLNGLRHNMQCAPCRAGHTSALQIKDSRLKTDTEEMRKAPEDKPL